MTKLTLNQSQIFLLSQGNSNSLIVYLKLRRKKLLIYAMPKKYNDKATMVVKDDNVNAQQPCDMEDGHAWRGMESW